MFELLQLFHPLLNDVLDFGLCDHQDFLLKEQDIDEKSVLPLPNT